MLKVSRTVETVTINASELSAQLNTWHQPLVLKGLVATWPAVNSSDIVEYLHPFCGQLSFNALVGSPDIKGRFFYNPDMSGFNFGRRQATMAEVLTQLSHIRADRSEQKPTVYLGSTSVEQCLPGFRQHNDLDFGAITPLVSAWIGNQTRIAAHFDAVDNIACVVAGKRRFTLFPPEQLSNLYVGPSDFTPAGQAVSLVDFHQVDHGKYPRFATAVAHAQVAELEPGDALFIPSMWWHHVEALDEVNLLVNYWWRQTPRFMGEPMDVFRHALMSIKALPAEHKQAWQGLFDHYIFNNDEDTLAHIPPDKRGELGEIDDTAARKLRAHLLNKLNR